MPYVSYRRRRLSRLFVAAGLIAGTTGLAAGVARALEPDTDTVIGIGENKPATQPTTQPTASPSAVKYPTPGELFAKMKEAAAKKDAQPKVAYFDLSERVEERPAAFNLFGVDRTETLHVLADRMRAAGDDKDVKAVLITLGSGVEINLAQAEELRDVLLELKRVGKRTFVFAESFDTDAYTFATGATDICMLGGGELQIPGVGFETMFYRGALDKIGVKPDYVQIGEFKGAEEPYTNTAPSKELAGELDRLSKSIFDEIVAGIAKSRALPEADVRAMIDESSLGGDEALAKHFVDHLVDQDGLRDLIKEQLKEKEDIDLVRDYGAPEREEIDTSNVVALFAKLMKRPEVSDKPAIAIIYAEGEIVDGDGGQSLLGGETQVGSESMRRAFRAALRDDNVKAVVLRIDSPGGSALASEVMWQAARRLAAKKPLVVSVGSMAASGGYYLASASDYIVADPAGIVGSIGVVGGKFVLKDLYDKLGLTSQMFAQGSNADLYSSATPWTDKQRELVKARMTETYKLFTQRVLTTRAKKITDIDQVARGRIFMARQAKEIGLVDELGGTEQAIASAAGRASLKKGDYDVRIMPAPKTFADLLSGHDPETATPIRAAAAMGAMGVSMGLESSPIFAALPADARTMLIHQIQFMRQFEKHSVALVSPVVLRSR